MNEAMAVVNAWETTRAKRCVDLWGHSERGPERSDPDLSARSASVRVQRISPYFDVADLKSSDLYVPSYAPLRRSIPYSV